MAPIDLVQDASAKQEIAVAREKARLAATEHRMIAHMKGDGWRPLPRRGDVKKRIAKDVKDALKGCVRPLKHTFAATRVHDWSVLVPEEDGQ